MSILCGCSNDPFKGCSRCDLDVRVRVQQFLVAGVAQHQSVLGIEKHEAFRRIFNGVHQPAARRFDFAQIFFFDLDGGIAENDQSLCHAADFVTAAGFGQRRSEVAPGDRQHAVAERGKPGNQVSTDIEPHDEQRADEAHDDDADQNVPVESLDRRGLQVRILNRRIRAIDQKADPVGQKPGQSYVDRQELFGLGDDDQFVFSNLRKAARADGQPLQYRDLFFQALFGTGRNRLRHFVKLPDRFFQGKYQNIDPFGGIGGGDLQEVVVDGVDQKRGSLLRDQSDDRIDEIRLLAC